MITDVVSRLRGPFDLLEDDDFDLINRGFLQRFKDTFEVLAGEHWYKFLTVKKSRFALSVCLASQEPFSVGTTTYYTNYYHVVLDEQRRTPKVYKIHELDQRMVELKESRFSNTYRLLRTQNEIIRANDILLNIEKDEKYLRLGVVDCLFFPLLAVKPILFLVDQPESLALTFCLFLIAIPFLAIEVLAIALRHITAFFLAVALLPAIGCFHQALKTHRVRRYTIFQEIAELGTTAHQEPEDNPIIQPPPYKDLAPPPPYSPSSGKSSPTSSFS